jgi:acetyltransferase-like isoleucine patch superfamily enzyme
MSIPDRTSFEDPIRLLLRIIKKLHSLWLTWTYPFESVGRRLSVHYSCDIRRTIAGYIKIGNDVLIDRDARVDVPIVRNENAPVILLDDGCKIGPRITILAINRIHVGKDAIFGPGVLLMDHDHEFRDITRPIVAQGSTHGGTIHIEEGCWIGFGAAIVCSKGELVIGRSSVVGANSVVTRSVPPYCVVTGNPARVVQRYDPAKKDWVVGFSGTTSKE